MQITQHIHALRIPFQIPVGPGQTVDRFVYAYVLAGENVALIDTGVAGSQTAIFDCLRSIGREPREIAEILLTHAHADHIGSARTIRELTNCRVLAHAGDRGWIEDVEMQFRQRPIPAFHSLVSGSLKVDILLQDGDLIDLPGAGEIEVIHTPGHSPGSVSFLERRSGALFCGDAVPVQGQMPVFDDFEASVRSVERLRKLKGVKTLLSCWDEPVPEEKLAEYFKHSLEYLHRIKASVNRLAGAGSDNGPAFGRQVLKDLGLPEAMLNPLVLRSFQAAMK
ncbi:MAG: MBL fold metallo-hydrolase [Candidatus Omnitrophota bacterium]|nr:MBL fold metallo-hydrolase [Candidatus Omnitrophota bacterium]MDZ4241282.1 MBL fold metallo-hydrolase [Candidatus Omnitrophota bacterium]